MPIRTIEWYRKKSISFNSINNFNQHNNDPKADAWKSLSDAQKILEDSKQELKSIQTVADIQPLYDIFVPSYQSHRCQLNAYNDNFDEGSIDHQSYKKRFGIFTNAAELHCDHFKKMIDGNSFFYKILDLFKYK